MMDREEMIGEYETELIKHLRKEAFDVKHCFTQYSFQGLTLVTAILGVAIKFADNDPYVGLIGVPLTVLLMTIARIGTHKYATANRLLGYELHLQRVRRYPLCGALGWSDRMRDMGWEEALRAWRIVQSTVFEYLYKHGNLSQGIPNPRWWRRFRLFIREAICFWEVDRLCPNLVNSNKKTVPLPNDRWFETRTHLKDGMSYYPGGYLQTMLNIIYLTAVLCMAFPVITCIRVYCRTGLSRQTYVVGVFVFLFSWYAFGRFFRTYRRRMLLEEGILSINSCAVLWQVTACAHFATLAKLRTPVEHKFLIPFEFLIPVEYKFLSYQNYSYTLGKEAIGFADSVFSPYDWYERANSDMLVSQISPLYNEKGIRVA